MAKRGFFGGAAVNAGALQQRFIVTPFSVLDTRSGAWIARKKTWLTLGIQGELGRPPSDDDKMRSSYRKTMTGFGSSLRGYYDKRAAVKQFESATGVAIDLSDDAEDLNHINNATGASVFDPVLTELIYRWFALPGYHIFDPFAGGSTRGVVAGVLGYDYTGVEIRDDQIAANVEQAKKIGVNPTWIHGDSTHLDQHLPAGVKYDLMIACPPYYDREVYSHGESDGSAHATYDEFVDWYYDVLKDSVSVIADNRFIVMIVGEIRNKRTGAFRNLVGDTTAILMELGLHYYNEIILMSRAGSLPIRTGPQFAVSRKIGKTHQNILVFWKGDLTVIPTLYRDHEIGDYV